MFISINITTKIKRHKMVHDSYFVHYLSMRAWIIGIIDVYRHFNKNKKWNVMFFNYEMVYHDCILLNQWVYLIHLGNHWSIVSCNSQMSNMICCDDDDDDDDQWAIWIDMITRQQQLSIKFIVHSCSIKVPWSFMFDLT